MSLPVSQRAAEKDQAWRDLQAQWGLHSLLISSSLIHLEAAIYAALAHFKDNPSTALESLAQLKDDINEQVTTPLAHFLQMAGESFNDLSTERRKCLAKSICDPQHSRWLEDTDESLMQFFLADVLGAIEASQAYQTDGLLTLASKAVIASQAPAQHAAASSQASFWGQHTEPYSSSCWPFRGGTSGNLVAGSANPPPTVGIPVSLPQASVKTPDPSIQHPTSH